MRLLWSIPALLLLLAAGAGCTDAPTLAPDVSPEQRARAAESMGLTFSPGTRYLLYHRLADHTRGVPQPDDAVHLKIALPADSLSSFLEQAPLAAAPWTTTRKHVFDAPSWPAWRPSEAVRYRSAQLDLPNAQVLGVLIDADRADTSVVYLHWSEM